MFIASKRTRAPQPADPSAGQGLVEFALVLPIFVTLILFLIEFAFAFNALLGVGYASRNAALIAAEAGNDPLADCLILQRVDDSFGAPGDKAKVTGVIIYRSDQAGAVRRETVSYSRTGTTTCTKGTTSVVVPYTRTGGTYLAATRCNVLNGCGVGRPIDTIGVDIAYMHVWVTPVRNFGPAGPAAGLSLAQSNAMRMEPIL